MPHSTSQSPLWTRDFIITTLANLFLFISFQMLIPTLPPYIEKLGGDNFIVGLVIGIFTGPKNLYKFTDYSKNI